MSAALPGHARPPGMTPESGEDYLYPSSFFVAVDLPDEVQELLRRQTSPAAATPRPAPP